MVEFHCWITLRYDDYHNIEIKQRAFLNRFKEFIENEHSFLLERGIGRIVKYNDLDCFVLSGLFNHKTQPFSPLEIMKWISINGRGSYGLLYILNDEDDQRNGDNSNRFKVWVLKRGNLLEMDDIFLSPYFPECEKPYDKNNPAIDR